jgi:hypothetical protein
MQLIQNALTAPPAFGPDQTAYRTLLGSAATGRIHGPVKGDRGYWVIQVVSTARHPGRDTAGYAALNAAWRDYWIQRLEPGVMARLRDRAEIQPPLARA